LFEVFVEKSPQKMDCSMSFQDVANAPKCPDCGAEALAKVGSLCASHTFAGKKLAEVVPGGNLWRCEECYLGFRYPTLAKAELDSLYRGGEDLTWSAPTADRTDWRIATDWLCDVLPNGASVLDIGCFDGEFLHGLGTRYDRFGIEIHPKARARAAQRGIEIIGSDFQAMPDTLGPFDCIAAIDFIEHTKAPRRFVLELLDRIKPGGYLLIATGNMDAPTFRLMGAGYWYCAFPEHIAFVSPRWSKRICELTGLRCVRQLSFSHGRGGFRRNLVQATKNLVYYFSPKLFFSLRDHFPRSSNRAIQPSTDFLPPMWVAAKDHFLTLYKKP
jgi:SAM-dependent methyltransferase